MYRLIIMKAYSYIKQYLPNKSHKQEFKPFVFFIDIQDYEI